MLKQEPLQECISSEDSDKIVYHFYDSDCKPIYKTKEVFKKIKRIVVYPCSYNQRNGQITPKKIKEITFDGWGDIEKIPNDFRKTFGYGFKTKRIKALMGIIYPKFREVEKITFAINGKNRFSKKTITLDWGNTEVILKKINREFGIANQEKKTLINNHLASLTEKFSLYERKLTAGELEQYLSKFGSFDKITSSDAETLAKIFDKLPAGKIITTSHFIKTKEKLDMVYLEDVIAKYKSLLLVPRDNEEQWQNFFEKYAWIFTHLFPYQVLLKKGKAYVGGKTIENDEGRIVDFLFATKLSDNMAFIEIKTHNKDLLKNTPYRKPAVFSSSDELSGGISQCLDQKSTFLKEYGKEHPAYDPKTILVIGQKSNLDIEQVKCFELLRANQKNVEIVTFDELLSKLEGLHKVLTGKFK